MIIEQRDEKCFVIFMWFLECDFVFGALKFESGILVAFDLKWKLNLVRVISQVH